SSWAPTAASGGVAGSAATSWTTWSNGRGAPSSRCAAPSPSRGRLGWRRWTSCPTPAGWPGRGSRSGTRNQGTATTFLLCLPPLAGQPQGSDNRVAPPAAVRVNDQERAKGDTRDNGNARTVSPRPPAGHRQGTGPQQDNAPQ